MTVRKIKAVRAWALAFWGDPSENWIYRRKADLVAAWRDAGHDPGESIVRVLITPLPVARRRRPRRKT